MSEPESGRFSDSGDVAGLRASRRERALQRGARIALVVFGLAMIGIGLYWFPDGPLVERLLHVATIVIGVLLVGDGLTGLRYHQAVAIMIATIGFTMMGAWFLW